LLTSCERRIDEEIDKRIRNEFENKTFLDEKLNLFKEEIVIF
jgi:hypothetical protein